MTNSKKVVSKKQILSRFILVSYPILVLGCVLLLLYWRFYVHHVHQRTVMKRRETLNIVFEIAQALGNYREEHGEPAPSLDTLVPKYLAEIRPSTTDDITWRYVSNSECEHGYDFAIRYSYDAGKYTAMYLLGHDIWQIDD